MDDPSISNSGFVNALEFRDRVEGESRLLEKRVDGYGRFMALGNERRKNYKGGTKVFTSGGRGELGGTERG